jgi:hypothetical protein
MTKFDCPHGIVDPMTHPVIRLLLPHHIVDFFALISLLYHHTIDDPLPLMIFSFPPPINEANQLMKFLVPHTSVFSEPSWIVFNLPHANTFILPASMIFSSPPPRKLDAAWMIFLYPPTIAQLRFEIQFSTHPPINPAAQR